MTRRKSEVGCVSVDAENDLFHRQCSQEKTTERWQCLERYWEDTKQRLLDHDGQKTLTSSLLEHLTLVDCVNEPSSTPETDKFCETANLKRISGVEINDIPTTYLVAGYEPHELIVIGTFVDKRITPGFNYKVRKNPSKEFLFDGKALPLETVGQGYGKRMTFRGESLNGNSNFFWSDSRPHGYAFTLQSVPSGGVFVVRDKETRREIGRAVVIVPDLVPDTETETTVTREGAIQKRARVHFSCDVSLRAKSQNAFAKDVVVNGEAWLVKARGCPEAVVEKIVLEDFVVDNCELVPE